MFMAKNAQQSTLIIPDQAEFPVIRTAYNKKHVPEKEVRTMRSMTVPDMTLSVLQIIKRSQAGLPITGSGTPGVYNGTVMLPDWNKLDFAERAAYIDAANNRLEFVKKRKAQLEKEQQEAAEAAAKQKAIDDAVAVELAKREKPVG